MKQTGLLFIVFSFFFSSAAAQKTLTVLHTSDTHSCILPLKKNLPDTMLADRGGFLRRIAMLKDERQKDPSLLLFDCGDFSQGSSYYTMFQGNVEVELMNRMHYDAATIGNHEFDFGLENMTRLFRMANFPIVCSNYDFADTGLAAIVKPYVVLKRKGVRVGVFALCPPLEGLVSAKNYLPLRYLDPAETATRMVQLLRGKERCDVVICLSHLGWEVTEYPDNTLLANTAGIDLVLGGHSHTYHEQLAYATDKAGRSIPVDHEGKHGAFIGKITLGLNKK